MKFNINTRKTNEWPGSIAQLDSFLPPCVTSRQRDDQKIYIYNKNYVVGSANWTQSARSTSDISSNEDSANESRLPRDTDTPRWAVFAEPGKINDERINRLAIGGSKRTKLCVIVGLCVECSTSRVIYAACNHRGHELSHRQEKEKREKKEQLDRDLLRAATW